MSKQWRNGSTHQWRKIRQRIIARDVVCQLCGQDQGQMHIDHIIPRSRGGTDNWTNVVGCSKDINSKKGNRLNSEVGLKLLKNPTVPQPVPVYVLIKKAKHEDHNHFISK